MSYQPQTLSQISPQSIGCQKRQPGGRTVKKSCKKPLICIELCAIERCLFSGITFCNLSSTLLWMRMTRHQDSVTHICTSQGWGNFHSKIHFTWFLSNFISPAFRWMLLWFIKFYISTFIKIKTKRWKIFFS